MTDPAPTARPRPRVATYRVQLHAGFGFDDAAAIVGYLARLGVSHLYCSPCLQAAAGSTHGYDVVDHSRINSELGGAAGHARLAGRLAEAGLINRVVPAGQALAAAQELAAVIAQGAPLSLAASKRIVVESADWNSDEAFARQGEIISPVFASADAVEGARAFAEKRPPAWRGE